MPYEPVTISLATETGQETIANAINNTGLNKIGNMSTLHTTDKTSLVGAINESYDKINVIVDDVTSVNYELKVRNGELYLSDINLRDTFGFIEHQAILNPSERIEYIGNNKLYSPITIDATTGLADYGDWTDFEFLTLNKPFMVKRDGTADYPLDPNDYSKKLDGTASDVGNTSYEGGAFAWIPKVYKYEYTSGTDRYVIFSFTQKTEDFKPTGFKDINGDEIEGIWIPMFYGTSVMYDNVNAMSSFGSSSIYGVTGKTTDQQKTMIDAFGSRAVFYGGPVVNTINDMLMMFAKSTDSQAVYGYGNMDSNSQQPNVIINGGQFYGTFTGYDANKYLHSIVAASLSQWQRDPYVIMKDGKVYISRYYTYDLTCATYEDTGVDYTGLVSSGTWYTPDKNIVIDDYGTVPDYPPYSGSTSLGNADIFIPDTSDTRIVLRYGYGGLGRYNGMRAWYPATGINDTFWAFGASPMILPPVGYSPYEEG